MLWLHLQLAISKITLFCDTVCKTSLSKLLNMCMYVYISNIDQLNKFIFAYYLMNM